MKSLRKIPPMPTRPHYRTRVIRNRQYLKVDGWRLFLIHWFVTLLYANRSTAYNFSAGFCFGMAFIMAVFAVVR